VVHEAVELLAYELQTDDVEVVFDLAEDLPVLWADAHQLHQVVVNLVANAHQAMRRAAAARRIRLTTRLDRYRVWLEIADTGPGIPRELQAKIFEPFFTTKPAGQGTGLGLSLCRGIVEDHRGALTVESEPGGGATFRIDLPRLPRPAPAPEAVVPPAPVRIAPRRILVVDDEAEIAGVLAEALERVGHRVEVAANGAEALEILTARACDLVISDTKMPGLDGLDLYREVERRFPSLRERMIFVTGDVLDAEKLAFLERSGVPVLMKPFDVREVRHLVHQVLVRGSHEP